MSNGARYQMVKLDLGAGASSAPVADQVPTSRNATIFRFSTANTSIAQLGAGATFTGAIETALDQPSISLLMTSDQPMTLTVRQFIDLAGTRPVPDIVFQVPAGVGFSRSFELNGNFVQVTARNDGASATTTFNLNTAYGEINGVASNGIMPVAAAAPDADYFVNSLATTNGALIATGSSGVPALYASNTGATAAFVKLFDKATAPVVGTDIPEMLIPVPAAVAGVPGVVELSPGFQAYRFTLGLGIAITGGAADSDTTAVAAGQVKVKLSRVI